MLLLLRPALNFNRWESVKSFINGLGKLSLQYILKIHKVKFYLHLLYGANSLVLDLFWLYYGDYIHVRLFGQSATCGFQCCVPTVSVMMLYFLFLTSLSFLTNKRVH